MNNITAKKRDLFVVNSVYQLLNALNLRMHVFADDAADIVISDIYPNHTAAAERLRASGLFDTVYDVNCKFIYKQEYEHSRIRVNLYRVRPEILLKKTGKVPDKTYSRYLTAGFDDYISMLFVILQRKNKHIEHIRFEDGGMSYVNDHASVNKVELRMQKLFGIVPLGSIKAPQYLYEPELYSVDDGRKLLPMPKLSRDDKEFLDKVNAIFGIDSVKCLDERAVFFEASYCEDGQTNNEADIIRRCHEILGGEFAIKLHPRNGVNRFKDDGISIMDSDIPWELYCLNNDVSGKTLISVTSNAAISPQLFLAKPPRTVLVYKLFRGRDSLLIIDAYRKYLKKLMAKCSRIQAPADDAELSAALLAKDN